MREDMAGCKGGCEALTTRIQLLPLLPVARLVALLLSTLRWFILLALVVQKASNPRLWLYICVS